jgi:hypothetical protein
METVIESPPLYTANSNPCGIRRSMTVTTDLRNVHVPVTDMKVPFVAAYPDQLREVPAVPTRGIFFIRLPPVFASHQENRISVIQTTIACRRNVEIGAV